MKSQTIIITTFFVWCLLFASFAYAGAWVENFNDGDYNGWKPVIGSDPHRAEVKVVNGELVFKYFNVGYCGDWLVLEASRNWSDYTLELRFKFTDEAGPGGTKGVLITYNDTFDGVPEGGPNCPFLFLEPYGNISGMLAKSGVWYTPASRQFAFSPGVWYQVKVLVQRSHYELFIDGQQVLTYDDATFTKGGIGIGARDVVTHFDDIRIYGDSVPDGGVTAVEATGKLAVTWAALK